MTERTFKTLNGKLKVKIPTKLNEITLGMMIEWGKGGLSDLEEHAIFLNTTKEALYDLKDARGFLDYLLPYTVSIQHQAQYLYSTEIPKSVTFKKDGKKVTVPVDLLVEPFGAYINARDLMADEVNKAIALHGEDNWRENLHPDLEAVARVLAHYFYCKVHKNKYDEQAAEAFVEEVKKLPVTEAAPIGRFFFVKYPDLPTKKIGFWVQLRANWKSALASRRLKSSAT